MTKLRTLIFQFLGIDLILIEKDKIIEFLTSQNEILRLENDALILRLGSSEPRRLVPEMIIPGRKSWNETAKEFEKVSLELYQKREREKKEREDSEST